MKKLLFLALMVVALVVSAPSTVVAVDVGETGNTVISPFWESGYGWFTFIAISNPSTASSASRTVNVHAMAKDGSYANTTDNASVAVGIGRGDTEWLYIGSSADGTGVAAATDASAHTHVIRSHNGLTNAYRSGSLIFKGTGNYMDELHFWGAVFAPADNSGFAMEFVGDKHDSLESGDKGL